MNIMKFIKNNYEIFVANFIVLGFIAITLLVQFGVHIKVDEDASLVPLEIGSVQSSQYIRRMGSVQTSESYIRLRYENDEEKSFWMPASVVFGKIAYNIEDMIKNGDSINRNVFINTKSDKVIGMTRSGKSILSLYYHNSMIFRYGIWILFFVDIFVGVLIVLNNKKRV